MKSSFKNLPGSEIELAVELSPEEFQVYWQDVFDRAVENVEIKGFRKGMAPKELAAQAINSEKILEEAAERAVRLSLNEVMQDNEWTLIDSPRVEINNEDSKGLSYKAHLIIFPKVDLGDYKKLVKKWVDNLAEAKKKIQVSEGDIDKALEWLRGSRAKLVSVTRASQKGDVVEVDIESSIDKPRHDQFILGKGHFLKGFEENLENRKAGEEVKFSLDFPADYWKEDWRGKKVDFSVKLKNVFDRQLPELNDEFAQQLNSEQFKTVADLKKNIIDGLRNEKELQEEEKTKIGLLEALVKEARIDTPKVMLERVKSQLSKQSPNITADKVEEVARQRVDSHLVIYKIAEIENLQPTEDELREEIAKHQHEFKQGQFDSQKFHDYIYELLQNKKVFNFLLTNNESRN